MELEEERRSTPDGAGTRAGGPEKGFPYGVRDGMSVLNRLHAVLTDYVAFPDAGAADAVTLWVAATHGLSAFQNAPRLVITSPEKRCGKSRLLDVVAGTSHDPLISTDASVASIFRSLREDAPPTLLIDEADALFGTTRSAQNHEELRSLLNAGYQRGRPILRCVGKESTPTKYPTFCMAVLAGIGTMPDTITDRAVNIRLRRRRNDEPVLPFRSRTAAPQMEQVREEVAAWVENTLPELAMTEPAMPVTDRAADTWEPLLAIAQLAGGDWPARASSACTALTGAAENDLGDDTNLSLLSDIHDIFTAHHDDLCGSTQLVEQLKALPESPWLDTRLTPRSLAIRLKGFGIAPHRDQKRQFRGYRSSDLEDAFSRYLPQVASEASEHLADKFGRTDRTDGSLRLSRAMDRNWDASKTRSAHHALHEPPCTECGSPARQPEVIEGRIFCQLECAGLWLMRDQLSHPQP